MMPEIIHQIREGRKDPIPEQYKQFAFTWKKPEVQRYIFKTLWTKRSDNKN
jgi:hypothetical protein